MQNGVNSKFFNHKAQPITYASILSFSLSDMADCFVSSEGFINNRLYVKIFDTENVILKHKQQLNRIHFLSTKMSEPPGANLTPTNEVYKKSQDFKDFSGQIQDC